MDIETTLEGGYLHVDSKAVKRAGLESLEILCSSPLMGNMTDAEIAEEYKKSGDYDANQCKMNVFVNNMVINFTFGLCGLHVFFDAFQDKWYGDELIEQIELRSRVIKSVAKWFSKRGIDEISEEFYEDAERWVAVQIITDLIASRGDEEYEEEVDKENIKRLQDMKEQLEHSEEPEKKIIYEAVCQTLGDHKEEQS